MKLWPTRYIKQNDFMHQLLKKALSETSQVLIEAENKHCMSGPICNESFREESREHSVTFDPIFKTNI